MFSFETTKRISMMILLTTHILMTFPKVGLSNSSYPIFNVQPTLYLVPRMETHLSLQSRGKNKENYFSVMERIKINNKLLENKTRNLYRMHDCQHKLYLPFTAIVILCKSGCLSLSSVLIETNLIEFFSVYPFSERNYMYLCASTCCS